MPYRHNTVFSWVMESQLWQHHCQASLEINIANGSSQLWIFKEEQSKMAFSKHRFSVKGIYICNNTIIYQPFRHQPLSKSPAFLELTFYKLTTGSCLFLRMDKPSFTLVCSYYWTNINQTIIILTYNTNFFRNYPGWWHDMITLFNSLSKLIK